MEDFLKKNINKDIIIYVLSNNSKNIKTSNNVMNINMLCADFHELINKYKRSHKYEKHTYHVYKYKNYVGIYENGSLSLYDKMFYDAYKSSHYVIESYELINHDLNDFPYINSYDSEYIDDVYKFNLDDITLNFITRNEEIIKNDNNDDLYLSHKLNKNKNINIITITFKNHENTIVKNIEIINSILKNV